MEEYIKSRLAESAKVKLDLMDNIEDIIEISNVIVNTYKKKGKVVLFGNGGSAADSQHIAAEFVGRYEMERPSLDAIALTTDTSCLTAIANDYGFDKLFERQAESIVKKKDVVIGLTTSGNSKNVLLGLRKSKELGATTVALAGKKDLYNGFLIYEAIRKIYEKHAADYIINVNSERTSVIQESHITIGHIICDLVEKKLFKK